MNTVNNRRTTANLTADPTRPDPTRPDPTRPDPTRLAPAGPASTRRRLSVIAFAVGVALIWWAILSQLFGIDLVAKQGSVMHIDGVSVFVATLLVSLAGWGLLAILERRTVNARNVWTVIATIFCLTSLGSPLLNGIGTDAKLALASLHLVVGACVILGLRRTALSAAERGC